MANHLLRVIRNDLVSAGLAQHDAEDAVGDVWAGFLRKINKEGPSSVKAPMAYLWSAAKKRRIDYGKAAAKADIPETDLAPPDADFRPGPNAKLDHYFNCGSAKNLIPVWQRTATLLVGALIDEAEVGESDAVKLVRETVKRLDPLYTEIVTLLLDYGPEQLSVQGANLLGISQTNFRQRKLRAYNQFREKAFQVARELRITWRGISDEGLSADGIPIAEEESTAEGDE